MGSLMENNNSDACFPPGGECVSAGQHNVNPHTVCQCEGY